MILYWELIYWWNYKKDDYIYKQYIRHHVNKDFLQNWVQVDLWLSIYNPPKLPCLVATISFWMNYNNFLGANFDW